MEILGIMPVKKVMYGIFLMFRELFFFIEKYWCSYLNLVYLYFQVILKCDSSNKLLRILTSVSSYRLWSVLSVLFLLLVFDSKLHECMYV